MSTGQVHAATHPFAPATASLNETIFAWQDDALCAETDPEIFHPTKGGSTRAAKRICASCSVTAQCLAYAIENNETSGIWGGRSPQQIRELRKERDAA